MKDKITIGVVVLVTAGVTAKTIKVLQERKNILGVVYDESSEKE